MQKSAKIAAISIAVAAACPSAWAIQLSDDESALRFRLKNELRRADKPSAGTGRDIYAWVQGGLIDFNSEYYAQFIGVEGGAYYVYKLGAHNDMSTRWYLDGHESFGYALGAIKIKPTENIRLKLGRFGTDYGYGSLPWRIPLIAGNSQRTLPTVSEGALGYMALTPNIELWAMWRSRVFQWTDSATGIRDEGVYNSATGKYDKHRPRTFLAASWHDENSRYSVGGSVQDDVSTQAQSIFEKRIPLTKDHALKGELLGSYVKLEGLSRSSSQPDETGLVSGQLSWSAPWGGLFASGGYLQHAMSGAVVDTDIGYPFSLSLDRNREGMQSWQAGVNYRLTPQLTMTLAPIVTRGYESSQRDVQIKGIGLLGAVNYKVAEGPLQGMNVFLAADKGREKRDGSTLGDRLNYWDVKMSIQYDFMLK
ncbi:glucuronide uptake porin UidC [Cedecea colo]|uniref:Glucuronide uptake porin UidC n=1 Tax=Cedecea colo TaxID=2552946 RepID=A0ABX0VNP5_9ENTR|nr:glucuronide uptake porin UidC [Cedecea colo]NIY48210.1 glucuronide uptake porin UidC [Cedecea colo]